MLRHWSVTELAGYVSKGPRQKVLPSLRRGLGSAANGAALFKRECLVSLINEGGSTQLRQFTKFNPADRRHFIGGSDARIIMGDDEARLVRLWREKRGEIEAGGPVGQSRRPARRRDRGAQPHMVSSATAAGRQRRPEARPASGSSMDGGNPRRDGRDTGAVFEAKFMLPWTFSEEAAAEKHMAQLQHNMWVVASRSAVLSIITGGGKWVEIKIHADPLYQHLLLTAEKKFWRCVQIGEPPRLFGVEPPRPRLEAVRVVDMSASNLWAEFAATYLRTRPAHGEHELAKAELKKLVPEDAKEAAGHGIKARRSKSGAISFDLLQAEPKRCISPVNRSARSPPPSPGPNPT